MPNLPQQRRLQKNDARVSVSCCSRHESPSRRGTERIWLVVGKGKERKTVDEKFSSSNVSASAVVVVKARGKRRKETPGTSSGYLNWSCLRMALAAQQSLLDELMGSGRNAGKGIAMCQRRFDDADVGALLRTLWSHWCFVDSTRFANWCLLISVHMTYSSIHDRTLVKIAELLHWKWVLHYVLSRSLRENPWSRSSRRVGSPNLRFDGRSTGFS